MRHLQQGPTPSIYPDFTQESVQHRANFASGSVNAEEGGKKRAEGNHLGVARQLTPFRMPDTAAVAMPPATVLVTPRAIVQPCLALPGVGRVLRRSPKRLPTGPTGASVPSLSPTCDPPVAHLGAASPAYSAARTRTPQQERFQIRCRP